MSQYVPMFDLKINVGHCDFALSLKDCLMYEHHTSGLRLFDVPTLYFVVMSQCNAAFALKQCRSQ